MNTKKIELNNVPDLEDLSKAEVITLYRLTRLEAEELRETVEQLTNLLRLRDAQKYGASSEHLEQEAAGQISLFDELDQGIFNEAEAIEAEAEAEEKPQKGHASRIEGEVGGSKASFDHLPVTEVIEELPEGEQECVSCQGELQVMKTTERIEIEVIPVKIIKTKYLTRTYVCPSCSEAGKEGAIKKAPGKLPILPGSYVSASLMSYIMAKKYWGADCDLQVVPMIGWERWMSYEDTNLPWVLPSPNLPTIESAFTFVGTVLFEGTNISEGRGTTRSLEIVGHPDIDPYQLLEELQPALAEGELEGFVLRPISFLPTFQKHQGIPCGGYQIHVIDRSKFRPWALQPKRLLMR